MVSLWGHLSVGPPWGGPLLGPLGDPLGMEGDPPGALGACAFLAPGPALPPAGGAEGPAEALAPGNMLAPCGIWTKDGFLVLAWTVPRSEISTSLPPLSLSGTPVSSSELPLDECGPAGCPLLSATLGAGPVLPSPSPLPSGRASDRSTRKL